MAKGSWFMKVIASFMILIICALLVFLVSMGFLSYEKKVPANMLVVEGWMPEYGLHRAFNEFQEGNYDFIFITGNKFNNFISLHTNSYIIFYPSDSLVADNSSHTQTFIIKAQSSLGKNDPAHFVFWINDNAVLKRYTTQQQGRFIVEWQGRLPEIDSLMIQFDNDTVSRAGDRNLRIEHFSVNGMEIPALTDSLFLDPGNPFGVSRSNITATSYAEMAKHFFVNRGIDPDLIIPVTNHHGDERRTLGNAMALKEWFDKNQTEVSGINVVSMDYHSRRTWLTYKKILGENMQVGIVSSPNFQLIHSAPDRYYYIFRESLALIYYIVFVLPWI